MATNKNQHFVPRCHLRPFTLDANGLSISLFNIERKRLIRNAPVKNQCSKDYFYGTDQRLEDAIQLLESGYSGTLRSVVSNSRFLMDGDKTVLRMFWIFQYLRTEAAAISAVQLAEATRDLADLPPGEYSLSIKEAVQIACRTFAGAMHELDDLKFCIVKNRTSFPFITSDNPAILTNRWQLDLKKTKGLSFGLGSAGLLVLLPLTPRILLLGYDGDVYSVPHERGISEVRNIRDVVAFNRHQMLQCVANVYVHDEAYESPLRSYFEEIEHARPKARHIVHYAELDGEFGGHKRYVVVPPENRETHKEAMMHAQVVHPHPGIWPSQVRVRANGWAYTNDTGAGYVRASRAESLGGPVFRRERL